MSGPPDSLKKSRDREKEADASYLNDYEDHPNEKYEKLDA
jgi:hypothetical protein